MRVYMRAFLFFLCVCSVSLLIMPFSVAHAGGVTWKRDALLFVPNSINATLLVGANSVADSLLIVRDRIMLRVPEGRTFSLVWRYARPGRFINDGGLPECSVDRTGNHIRINGPKTITLYFSALPCPL